ncbi:uncharacterized protein [Nicotiana sylvestris]|uniref:uncharacterized protein n=1 Tax=Nicotiana sylvestris TaxID=4096 RepID=UPI00388C4FF6
MRSIEQSLKNIQGLSGQKSVSYADLCMFPHVHLPLGFKTPKFEKYDGHGDPIAHLKRYYNQLRGAGGKEELQRSWSALLLNGTLIRIYLGGIWDDLAWDFVRQFQYNIDIAPDRNSLSNLKKKSSDNFREYTVKWREQTARVKPPIDEIKMVSVFLQAQEADYFQNMMYAMGKPFADAIKIGEMVENSLKTGSILSQSTIRATSQAIQGGSGGVANRKKKEEVAMATSWIVLKDEDIPNVTNNPLPDHNNRPVMGIICEDEEFDPALKAIIAIADVEKKLKATTKQDKGRRREVNKATEKRFPLKKPISAEEAEEFFRKMKTADYEIIDQLRKSHAQVSLLSLLMNSTEHQKISFSKNDLPPEGATHNKALHLTVKCEGYYMKRVMLDGGSGVDICPLSTSQRMEIGTERIRPNNVCVRAFDGIKRETIGEIDLILTIGHVDFEVTFQVLDMDTSYNFLLGKPWINAAGVVPSTLY